MISNTNVEMCLSRAPLGITEFHFYYKRERERVFNTLSVLQTDTICADGNEVFSLQPFTSRDLMLRSLADRILDLSQLQFLYPNVAKNDVFSKYYTKPGE